MKMPDRSLIIKVGSDFCDIASGICFCFHDIAMMDPFRFERKKTHPDSPVQLRLLPDKRTDFVKQKLFRFFGGLRHFGSIFQPEGGQHKFGIFIPDKDPGNFPPAGRFRSRSQRPEKLQNFQDEDYNDILGGPEIKKLSETGSPFLPHGFVSDPF